MMNKKIYCNLAFSYLICFFVAADIIGAVVLFAFSVASIIPTVDGDSPFWYLLLLAFFLVPLLILLFGGCFCYFSIEDNGVANGNLITKKVVLYEDIVAIKTERIISKNSYLASSSTKVLAIYDQRDRIVTIPIYYEKEIELFLSLLSKELREAVLELMSEGKYNKNWDL